MDANRKIVSKMEEHALLITEIRQIGCMVDFWKQ